MYTPGAQVKIMCTRQPKCAHRVQGALLISNTVRTPPGSAPNIVFKMSLKEYTYTPIYNNVSGTGKNISPSGHMCVCGVCWCLCERVELEPVGAGGAKEARYIP